MAENSLRKVQMMEMEPTLKTRLVRTAGENWIINFFEENSYNNPTTEECKMNIIHILDMIGRTETNSTGKKIDPYKRLAKLNNCQKSDETL